MVVQRSDGPRRLRDHDDDDDDDDEFFVRYFQVVYFQHPLHSVIT